MFSLLKKGKIKKDTNNTVLPNDGQNVNSQVTSDLNVQAENVNTVDNTSSQEVIQNQSSTLSSAEPVQNDIINQPQVLSSNTMEQSTQPLDNTNGLNQNNN